MAACAGHTASPSAAPAPASRPAAAAAAPANTIRYAAGTGRYRFEQILHTHQDQMGQIIDVDLNTTMQITAALTAAPDGGMDGMFTVDSVSMTGNQGTAAVLDALKGKTFHTVFNPQGKAISFTAPDSSPAVMQTRDLFREFVPVLPAGTLNDGMSWVDTLTQPPINAQGINVRSQSIRTHRIVGWEQHDGQRAVHINTASAITINGEGEANGTPLTLSGTGTGITDRFVAANGTYLGATSHDSTNISIAVVTAGVEIPIRQVRNTTVTRLP
ncbi:MAG TPA: hypothetical protein VGI92_04370 [Gemmatimonadales bacterium]